MFIVAATTGSYRKYNVCIFFHIFTHSVMDTSVTFVKHQVSVNLYAFDCVWFYFIITYSALLWF